MPSAIDHNDDAPQQEPFLKRLEKTAAKQALTIELKSEISRRLLTEVPPDLTVSEVRERASEIIRAVVADKRFDLPSNEQMELVNRLIDEAVGFGKLDPLLRDKTVREIIIADPRHVYVRRYDQLEQVVVDFDHDHYVLHVLDRMVRDYSSYYLRREKLPPALSLPWERGTVTIICPPETKSMVVVIDIARPAST